MTEETATIPDFEGKTVTADVGFINEGVLGMIAHGYTEATRCLSFRVRFHEGVGADAAVRLIGDYNDFDGERVGDALSKLVGRVQAIEVGRAFSPLVMVHVGGGHHNPPATVAEVLDTLRGARPDELSREDGGDTGNVVRAWWD